MTEKEKSTSHPKKIQHASIHWNDEGQPIATEYDDVYFSKESGIDETRYVFIDNNHLTTRWQSLPCDQSGFFTIAETGFGTGLNFLATVQEWLKTAPPSWRLHFISVEKFPLSLVDLKQALALWPELSELKNEFFASYPSQIPGFHRLNLYQNRVSLTLLFGEADTMFQQLKGSSHPLFSRTNNPVIDAWFLDGFAPAKNPDMWSSRLFKVIGELSDTNTTFATFTAAGLVRRGLKDVGFNVEKVKGFGRKREMARGVMTHSLPQEHPIDAFEPSRRNSPYPAPWYLHKKSAAENKSAVIIGGGIAGCSTARALAQRGWTVTLVERHQALAQEASGNPQGITYPKLSKKDSPLSRYGLYSLMYCARYYSELWDQQKGFGERCGVLIVPESEKKVAELEIIGQRFAEHPEIATLYKHDQLKNLTGIELHSANALFHPNLGWLNAEKSSQELAKSPHINHLQAEVSAIKQHDSGIWHLLNHDGETLISTETLIIAAAMNSILFKQTDHLPLKPIRGQITVLKATKESKQLTRVICGAGYASPVTCQTSTQGEHTIGSTYHLHDDCTDIRPDDNIANIDKMTKTDRGLGRIFNQGMEVIKGRTAFRCTTPDYLPVVGPAPDEAQMRERFALLSKNAKANIPATGAYYQGLYLNCGYGSRGLSYAPLAAELLAAQITGEVLPMEQDLAMTLNPARFIIRNLKRGK